MNLQLKESFKAFLMTKGYAERTIHLYSKGLDIISDAWDTDDPSLLYEHINTSLKALEPCLTTSSNNNIRAAARQFFHFKTGVIYKDHSYKVNEQQTDCVSILTDFTAYSLKFKGLSSNTAKSECHHIQNFLLHFGNITYDSLTTLTAHDLSDYVCSELKDLKTSSIGRYITSLRNFFRFLEYRGYPINKSILELPLAAADWGKGKVPVILTKDEEKRLRNHHPLNQKNDTRNRLIIHLMLDLGMRCSEVSKLKLSDISWNKGTLNIHHSKNGNLRELPIPNSLGNMIEEYVLSERPKTENEILFVRKYLQRYLPMNTEAVRRVVREALKKENICGWWKGTHALRRTAASRIYNSGAGLKITADFLGHKSVDSTTAYVKVDIDSLRSVAATWPGGITNE